MSNFFKFYGYFASFIGTVTLVTVLISVVTRDNIQFGLFGLYGIPILGLIYAFLRVSGVIVGKWEVLERNRLARLEAENNEFKSNRVYSLRQN